MNAVLPVLWTSAVLAAAMAGWIKLGIWDHLNRWGADIGWGFANLFRKRIP